MSEWISVKDRMPGDSGYYLVSTTNGNVDVVHYSKEHQAFNAFDSDDWADFAILCTHWMPIPEPPEVHT